MPPTMLDDLAPIVTYNPWSLCGDMRLRELAEVFYAADISNWPVLDDDRSLIGIVSERDVVRAVEECATAARFRDDRQIACEALEQCRVADIMARKPPTLRQNQSPWTAIKMILDGDLQGLPLLDRNQLVGLVTRADVLREFSYGDWPISKDSVLDALEDTPELIEGDVSLDEAAIALRCTNQKFVGVLRGNLPVGVISERDILLARCRDTIRWLREGDADASETTVFELAASAPMLRPGERLSEAASAMVEQNRQAVAVVNQAGRLLGVVTEVGILNRLFAEFRG